MSDESHDEGPPEPEAAKPEAAKPAARPPITLDVLRENLRLFDFSKMPDTKAGWVLRIVVTLVAVAILVQRAKVATAPLVAAKPPPTIATEDIEGYRFRIPDEIRHAIFDELATAELAERERAIKQNTWNGHAWSREDDRGHFERVAVRAAASKYKVSIAQVYLVLDEGIRERWPAPNGEPLPATTPPLSLRASW